MNRKGVSLVELIAVIVIMGIISSITLVTVFTAVERQRINATINTLDNIYSTAKGMLYLTENASYDENITINDDRSFCYISLNTMINEGIIEGNDYLAEEGDIFFCFDMNETWVEIGNEIGSTVKPTSTETIIINKVEISFDFNKDKFVKA